MWRLLGHPISSPRWTHYRPVVAGGTCTRQQQEGAGWTRPLVWGRQPACMRPAWPTTPRTTALPQPSVWQLATACWAARLLFSVRLLSSEPWDRQCREAGLSPLGPSGGTQAGLCATVLIARKPRDSDLQEPISERKTCTTVTFLAAEKYMAKLLILKLTWDGTLERDLLSVTGCSVARDSRGQTNFRDIWEPIPERRGLPAQPAIRDSWDQTTWRNTQRHTWKEAKPVILILRTVVATEAPPTLYTILNLRIATYLPQDPHNVVTLTLNLENSAVSSTEKNWCLYFMY